MKKNQFFYDVICLLILRGKTCQSTASLLFMITPPPPREYSRNMLMNDHHEKRTGSGQMLMNDHHEKDPEVVNTKKDQHEKRTGSG